MLLRYAYAISSGIFATFALLFIMQSLITLQPGAESDARERRPIIFTRQKPHEPPVTPKQPEIKREDLSKPIEPPARSNQSMGLEPIYVPRSVPQQPGIDGPTVSRRFSDGPLVNLVRVGPSYPSRAIAQELEGYVVVEFDVTAEGRVINVVVIESSSRLFEDAAIKAARDFKFKPRIVDGIALESHGIRNLFRFTLDER